MQVALVGSNSRQRVFYAFTVRHGRMKAQRMDGELGVRPMDDYAYPGKISPGKCANLCKSSSQSRNHGTPRLGSKINK